MYKRIIAALDPSHLEHGAEILTTAHGMLADGGEILALGIIEEVPAYVAPQIPAGLMQEAQVRARADIRDLVERQHVPAEVLVEAGHTWRTICDEADRRGADLVIVHSHRPGFSDLFLGSVAGQVVRHCNTSVLVLR